MSAAPDPARLIAEAEALLARAKQSLAAGEALAARHGQHARELLAHLQRRRADDMRLFVKEQVHKAHNAPILPCHETPPDSATAFARRVWRRRTLA